MFVFVDLAKSLPTSLVRYADDSVMGFQYEWDARRFLAEMRVRLAQFKLELHPDKTWLFRFGRYAEIFKLVVA